MYLVMGQHVYVVLFGLFLVILTEAVVNPHGIHSAQSSDSVIPGQYIVMVDNTLPPGDEDGVKLLSQTMAKLSSHTLTSAKIGSKSFVLVSDSNENIAKLRDLPGVVSVEPNLRCYAMTTGDYQTLDAFQTEEEDTNMCHIQDITELWGLDRIDQRTQSGANTVYLHGSSSDGSGVVVYVVDSGVNINDAEFEGRAVWGFTTTELKSEGDVDLNGHGTHVAGTVGAAIYGVAKKVSIVAVKVLGASGSGSGSGFITGMEWVIQDYEARGKPKSVINLSLGFNGISTAVDYAVQQAIDSGIKTVVAAGNSHEDACATSPAHIDDVITVGASNIFDQAASFSNWGTCLDVWAPGVDILSVFPDPQRLKKLDGTSMASPHVAGVVARYLSSLTTNPTPAEVEHWVTSTATSGAIKYATPSEGTSPNRLLYMGCDSHYTTPYPPTPTPSPNTNVANKVNHSYTTLMITILAYMVVYGIIVNESI